MKSIKQIGLITMMMCFLFFTISASGVVYVNKNATGANNGNSWADAYTTIQAGIDDADVADEEVWVAQGTYPEAIVMKSGVKLYGGFNGTETARSQRKWTTNVTIIDASTARGGSPAYHVVIMNNITNATIDGFTITGGNANGGGTNDDGGGIFCYNLNDTNIIKNNTISGNSAADDGGGIDCGSSSPAISNNIISGNWTSNDGGGISCIFSSPAITDNTISGNLADDWGGGIFCSYSSPAITNNTISRNSANSGGGIDCTNDSSPQITNNTISGNSAPHGGGITCSYSSSPQITNNTISGNSAGYDGNGGGIYCSYSSSPQITNNTISGNSAGHYGNGGGIYCKNNSDPKIKNTIFYNNNKYDIYEYDTSSDPLVSYNDFYGNAQGIYYDEGTTPYTSVAAMDSAIAECSNNIGLNPLFVGDTLSGGGWTAAPFYNSATFQTTLTNTSASWTPDEHSGRLLNPDTSQNKQFAIVSNTATTMTIWGNVTAIAHSGDTYKIYDYHLQLASPCIDAGYDQGVPNIDFDGEPRPMDVLGIDNNGPLAEYDIGADEYPGVTQTPTPTPTPPPVMSIDFACLTPWTDVWVWEKPGEIAEGNPSRWAWLGYKHNINEGWQTLAGDFFNNDGLMELACITQYGSVWACQNNGNSQLTNNQWQSWGYLCDKWQHWYVFAGDFNGDGRDDLVQLNGIYSEAWVGLNNGTNIPSPSYWGTLGFQYAPQNQYWIGVGDVNGDGRDDLVQLTPYGDAWVALSSGLSFGAPSRWGWLGFKYDPANAWGMHIGDFNGDGKADLCCVTPYTDAWVSLSTGSAFGAPSRWGWLGFSDNPNRGNGWNVFVGDVNVDGKDDLIQLTEYGDIWFATSTGSGFNAPYRAGWPGFCHQPEGPWQVFVGKFK